MPSTSIRWKARKNRNTGTRESTDIANIGPTETWPEESMKERSATGTVFFVVSETYTSWRKKSFHVQMNEKIAVVTRAGRDSGRITLRNTPNGEQPSIFAASSSSRGMPRMNWTMRKTKNASVARKWGMTSGRY